MPLFLFLFVVNYFLDFPNFFCFDRGVGGWGVSYPNFFGFLYIFYIYKAPYTTSRGDRGQL